MSFHVSRIVVTGFAWRVTDSYTNHSTKTLRVTRGDYPTVRQTGTGIWYPTPPPPGQTLGGTVFRAAHAKLAFPSLLRPGKTWSGTFSGYGRLPHDRLIFIVFGYFTPVGEPLAGFNYTLNHGFRL